jgi:hypothetical protein
MTKSYVKHASLNLIFTKRDKINVPNAVVILSCQTFVKSRSDPVALSPSAQIALAHGEEQMFVLSQARFMFVPFHTDHIRI